MIDWIGTLAFAFSGGLAGVRKRLDLFGVLFLSFVAAVAGGVLRDVLIGAVPPEAIAWVHYFVIAIGGGLITFFWYTPNPKDSGDTARRVGVAAARETRRYPSSS